MRSYQLLSESDKIVIKSLREEKGLSLNQILKEYPNRNWKKSTVIRFLKKLRETGSAERRPGSGRPKCARTQENIEAVEDLVLSQEGRPGTSCSQRQVAKRTGISRSSVRRIIKKDLQLKVFKRVTVHELSAAAKTKRLERCKKLLRRFRSTKSVKKIWFTDEKRFTVEAPQNAQNDRIHVAVNQKKEVSPARLLRERKHFSESVMVSIGASFDGKTSVFFIARGVKINGQCYRQDVLTPMLSEIIQKSPDFVFQQDGAPAHTARDTVAFLKEKCPDFIEPPDWPPCSPDLNPLDYFVWSTMEEKVYHGERIRNIDHLKQRILDAWDEMPQSWLAKAISKWRSRMQAVVDNGGGHIEPFLKN